MLNRVERGRKTKAGKHFFLWFLYKFFPIACKSLLKCINGDSLKHEKGYLPQDPGEAGGPV